MRARVVWKLENYGPHHGSWMTPEEAHAHAECANKTHGPGTHRVELESDPLEENKPPEEEADVT